MDINIFPRNFYTDFKISINQYTVSFFPKIKDKNASNDSITNLTIKRSYCW